MSMYTQKEIILKIRNRKNICFKSPNLAVLSLFCFWNLFFGNMLFSESGSYSSSSTSNKFGLGNERGFNKETKGKGGIKASKGKYIDYFKSDSGQQETSLVSNVPIAHVSEGVSLQEGLTVAEYQILVKDYLSKKYTNLNLESVDSKFFFRAIAENAYSQGGYLSASKLNSIIDARATYLKINEYIDCLDINSDIKKKLKKLYIFACIYMQKVRETVDTLKKIKKIPRGCIVYELKNYTSMKTLGEYTASMAGENLYYICAAFYKDFIRLSKKQQVKVMDEIYAFNPTLQVAPPIIARYNFYYWVMSIFPSNNKSSLLKYCLRGNIEWLILPKNIDVD